MQTQTGSQRSGPMQTEPLSWPVLVEEFLWQCTHAHACFWCCYFKRKDTVWEKEEGKSFQRPDIRNPRMLNLQDAVRVKVPYLRKANRQYRQMAVESRFDLSQILCRIIYHVHTPTHTRTHGLCLDKTKTDLDQCFVGIGLFRCAAQDISIGFWRLKTQVF